MSDAEPGRRFRRVTRACWIAILAVDAASLAFFASGGLNNLYGDGIAHVAGARLLFDSRTPGYAEIGSVWLPLFHVLAAPLALSDTLWRTGLAGSLVSAAAFAGTAWLVFRLASEMSNALAPGVLALAFLLLSPNLLYGAATPLTESLALFWSVLTVYALFRFSRGGTQKALIGAGLAAFCGTLTRYDEWFVLPFAAAFVFLCRARRPRDRVGETLLFSLIAGLGPLLWLAHNAYRFHNPWEFYDGPYSAQAIYAHQLATTGFRYPTDGSLWCAVRYYLEDLKLVFGPLELVMAALGINAWLRDGALRRRRSAALLLLVPLIFYPVSMAHASVALYVPTLFPYTYYNLRYGLEMAPGLAVFAGFVISPRLSAQVRRWAFAAACAVLALQAGWMLRAGPRKLVMVQEAILNTPCKSPAEQAVIRSLRAHYHGETVLLANGEWPCVMPEVGIPYRNTLTSVNRKYWRKLRFGADRYVGLIIVKRGDAVDELMKAYPKGFTNFELIREQRLAHGSYVAIYRCKRPWGGK